MTPRRGAACQVLAARVRAAALDGDQRLGETVALRVFDALGALAASRGVRATPVLPPERGLVTNVRRLCAAVRSTETDDFDRRSCTTPGSAAVPVALLVGAELSAPGERLRAGVIAGYEAMIAIGEAAGGPDQLARGIWPSYLAAPLAAAAAAASVLDLDETRTTHALAIAAARAVGTSGNDGQEPTSRWLSYGCAAADGVLAAFAANAGMVGDPDALAGPLADATGVQVDKELLAVPVGGVMRVDVKPFCTARQVLAAVEAAQRAHGQLAGELIGRIDVAVPAAHREMVDQPDPLTRLDSITSAQYQIATALTDHARLYDVAREDRQLSGRMVELMRVIHVAGDDDLTDLYPDVWGSRVRIRGVAGGEAQATVSEPLGARERPLGWAGLREKHARIGALGRHLERAMEISHDLGRGASAPATELLNLITTKTPRRSSQGSGR